MDPVAVGIALFIVLVVALVALRVIRWVFPLLAVAVAVALILMYLQRPDYYSKQIGDWVNSIASPYTEQVVKGIPNSLNK